MPHAPQWCFAEFRVDSGNKCLWRGAHAIKLKPRTFDVLSFLVERAGRLVTRTELFAALWSQTYVSETALTNCLSELRKALHDTTKPPRFIETVHRRGYRFIAPIVDSQQSGMSHHENPQTPSVLSQTADCGLRTPFAHPLCS
jgi:DNA-binding winged helix-turn-helix (wHTH) protein